MILKYIDITLNDATDDRGELPTGTDSESQWFDFRGFNLGYFLSLRLMKLRFNKGDYTQIVIFGFSGKVTDFVGKEGVNDVNNLIIKCSFDKDYYRSLSTVEEYNEYYIKLYKEGINNILSCTDQPVPKKELFEWMDEYRAGGYENKWQFKKRLFREIGLQVVLDCEMTLEGFYLTFRLYRFKGKQLLFEKMILETKPDVSYFHRKFKDAVLEGNTIKVVGRAYDALEEPLYEMDVSEYIENE